MYKEGREREEREKREEPHDYRQVLCTILSVLCIVPKKLFKVNHPTPHRH